MLAFNAKHPYVPDNRWIVSLSDGSTIFEDLTPGAESAWSRLKKYVQYNHLILTNLRLEHNGRLYNLAPYRDDNNLPQILGYWQASKITAFLNAGISETIYRGIGYIHAKDPDKINISWIDPAGNIISETRLLNKNDMGVIWNEV